jgi:hypothetical protein
MFVRPRPLAATAFSSSTTWDIISVDGFTFVYFFLGTKTQKEKKFEKKWKDNEKNKLSLEEQ